MDDLSFRLRSIQSRVSESGALLVLVSKGRTDDQVMAAYSAAARHFGENRTQALVARADALPRDIYWHMIGHLQRNKVKSIAPFVHRIHSVDSRALLAQIDKEARRCNRLLRCLLQVHIAQESAKHGFTANEAMELLSSEAYKDFPYVSITGLMGMATHTEDTTQVQLEFQALKKLFDRVKEAPYAPADWGELSMGMSGDYELALQTGANVIRIGRAIFEASA